MGDLPMIAVLALGVMQAVVVSVLIAERSKRRRAEHALRTSEAALRSSMGETQTLAGRLIVSQESERRRIARDLHDNLGQKLSLLCIDIDRLGVGGTAPAIVEVAAHLSKRAHDIASDVHRLSHDLHSPCLEILGLAPAIDNLCRDVSYRCGVQIAFRHRAMDRRVPADVALVPLPHHAGGPAERRQSQRRRRRDRAPCPNRARHSSAHCDNGQGFDLASKDGAGLGLLSMRERARFAGGRIAIRSAAGRGTRIVVSLPMPGSAFSLTFHWTDQ